MPMDRGGFNQLPAASNRINDNAFRSIQILSFLLILFRLRCMDITGSINDLLSAANEGKVLAAEGSSDSECNSAVSKGGANCHGWKFFEEHLVSPKGNSGKSVSASILLQKLRWSTLGLQFEWSKVICLGTS
ncbi:alpha-ketoglutarate-dependent dioxygenase alkB [Pyrus ussuriensis x Pyrus communis]|uniref:Alpha-ketoglutarate-dependent dioxygenase alkB n=1 Tax=Pyrus ussuriensis x Pyrus communis TaxID=2448454 RepID=A0A5N5HDG3_9ROSA|nr:alpha-ketoglutarate-dependent dioxygenase alkB [Pyrus ussuriensis x Pyrus communis]